MFQNIRIYMTLYLRPWNFYDGRGDSQDDVPFNALSTQLNEPIITQLDEFIVTQL